MDSLAREEARQDLLTPPIPDALLGTQLAQPQARTLPGSSGESSGQLPVLPGSNRSRQPLLCCLRCCHTVVTRRLPGAQQELETRFRSTGADVLRQRRGAGSSVRPDGHRRGQ